MEKFGLPPPKTKLAGRAELDPLMMRTSELDMADSVHPADIYIFIDNAAWAICSTYHTVLKASPGAAIFGRDRLFDILFVADWKQIGDYRQNQMDCSNTRENNK